LVTGAALLLLVALQAALGSHEAAAKEAEVPRVPAQTIAMWYQHMIRRDRAYV